MFGVAAAGVGLAAGLIDDGGTADGGNLSLARRTASGR
jgi:hypothetical protein